MSTWGPFAVRHCSFWMFNEYIFPLTFLLRRQLGRVCTIMRGCGYQFRVDRVRCSISSVVNSLILKTNCRKLSILYHSNILVMFYSFLRKHDCIQGLQTCNILYFRSHIFVNVYYADLQIALVVDLRCCHSISDCSVVLSVVNNKLGMSGKRQLWPN